MKSPNRAFTLIELLVVIAIIGILSSVVLAALSGARERAQITRTVSDLEQIETALTMWMQGTGRVEWPHPDNDLGGIGQHTGGDYLPLETMVEETSLGKYLTSVPEPPLGGHYEYHYDYNDPKSECGTPHKGTNITTDGGDITPSIAEEIDQMVDQEADLNCGRLRYYNSSWPIYYSLSEDNSF